MGKTSSINFFAAAIMLMACVLTISVLPVPTLATNYQSVGYYDQPPPGSPPPRPSPMCRNETELCLAYGDYTCCKGLNCILGDPILPVGVGSCLPLGEQPPSTDECRRINHLCHPYGQYKCCDGMSCVDTRTLPPVAGVNTQELELPPGVGVCEAIKL